MKKHEPGPPMTLGNMREQGVRGLRASGGYQPNNSEVHVTNSTNRDTEIAEAKRKLPTCSAKSPRSRRSQHPRSRSLISSARLRSLSTARRGRQVRRFPATSSSWSSNKSCSQNFRCSSRAASAVSRRTNFMFSLSGRFPGCSSLGELEKDRVDDTRFWQIGLIERARTIAVPTLA